MQRLRFPRVIGNYTIDQSALLGKGATGRVYVAYRNSDEIKMACKSISKKYLAQLAVYNSQYMKESQQQFELEINPLFFAADTLLQFHLKLGENKHIVRLYDSIQENDAYYLFMEYCSSDMAKLMEKRQRLPEPQATDYIKQLCLGYQEIYLHNGSHRDLKPQNLLLKKGVLKIADFGFVKEIAAMVSQSQKNNARTSTFCGTPEYIPPNVIEAQDKKTTYDPEKFDMWSIGIIYYFFLYGKRPFKGDTAEKLFEEIQHRELVFPEEPEVSQHTKKIITRLLDKNEDDRLEFRQLMKELGLEMKQITKAVVHKRSDRMEEEERSNILVESSEVKQRRNQVETSIKMLEFLNYLTKQVYAINSKYTIFRKIKDSNRILPYKLIVGLHELRQSKLQAILKCEQLKIPGMSTQREKVQNLKTGIQEFDQVFLPNFKEMIQGESEDIDQSLKKFAIGIAANDDLFYYDVEIKKCVLCLLNLKGYREKKLSSESLYETMGLQIKDSEKINLQLKGHL